MRALFDKCFCNAECLTVHCDKKITGYIVGASKVKRLPVASMYYAAICSPYVLQSIASNETTHTIPE